MPASQTPAAHTAWTLPPSGKWALRFLYACAGFLFTRAHLLNSKPYLDLQSYLAGHERLPYQRRVLPMLILRGLAHLHIPATLLRHSRGIFATPELIYLFAIDLICVACASYFCLALHRAASPTSRFRWLVFPIFLFTLTFTYLVHTEANLYYPYDMLSLAFFSAGLYFIYTNRFLALALVMLIGTFNRETTVFLIPLFLLNAAPNFPHRIPWRNLPWLKAAVLALIWLAIRITLAHFYKSNDATDAYLRYRFNLRYLPPNNWPQLLGGCGFLLPILWFLRHRILNPRIAAYIWILPLWAAVMWCYAVMMETRIYGELCPLAAVAAILLLDAYTNSQLLMPSDAPSRP